jgi:tRNA(fMet)-specific endonuclease VapC
MRYLLDTDIASYYLRGKFNLLEIFKNKGIDNIRISRVSVAELEVLAFKNPSSVINFSSIKFFSIMLGIIEIDEKIWQTFSYLKSKTSISGKTKGDMDILIASTARQHNLVLVTRNTRHYKDLVQVEDWTAGTV